MINPNIQAKYLDNSEVCPFCNSTSMGGTVPTFSDSKTIVREVECYGCRQTWMETYKLASIEENI